MPLSTQNLKEKAAALGFNLVGITRAVPSSTLAAYMRWIEQNMHAGMGYMARPDRIVRRQDLNIILPGVQSLVIVGLDYGANVPQELLEDPSRGRFAAYAWGQDYHELMKTRLETLAGWLQQECGPGLRQRVYVDTGAVLERSHAQQAGMGFIGKNTMLIHARRGSYFFLGEILLTEEFDSYDEAHTDTMCGTCSRCLQACPTAAFPRPYVLDSRRCISYHTIENKGWIDTELRERFGNWVFGCDVCQDVCPFQRFTSPATEPALRPPEPESAAPPLLTLLTLDDRAFEARYRGTPVYRIRRARLVRNACIAAGNWGSEAALPALQALLNDEDELVRGHAAWALWRITGGSGHLQRLRDADPSPQVREEAARLIV